MKQSIIVLLSLLLSLHLNSKVLGNFSIKEKATAASVGLAYDFHITQNNHRLHLALNNNRPGTVTVTLFDQQRNIVFTKKFKNESNINHNYSLSSYDAGLYSLKVEKGAYIKYHVLYIGEPMVSALGPYDVFISSGIRNEKVLITYTNSRTPVSILMTNQEGEVIYKQEILQVHHHVYIPMNKLMKGLYTLTVTGSEKVVSKVFGINNTTNLKKI
ncbi:hypothetical protein AAG747_10095 [Rapidithrix thailandica]|uniref:Secretion system C-terminal sorting domain-containing protein n=1 Tax=Rapidithrix thailandica TaxID=413964 RepID=A0AAW9S317_9BACT